MCGRGACGDFTCANGDDFACFFVDLGVLSGLTAVV